MDALGVDFGALGVDLDALGVGVGARDKSEREREREQEIGSVINYWMRGEVVLWFSCARQPPQASLPGCAEGATLRGSTGPSGPRAPSPPAPQPPSPQPPPNQQL